MRQASIYVSVDRTRLLYSNGQTGQIGPAAIGAGNFLAVLCLLFGIAFTAFVPASPEQRIASLFLFGLIPAAGCYAGGHILGHLLMLGSELCEKVAVHCFRCAALLVTGFVSSITPTVSSLSPGCLIVFARCALSRLPALGRKTYRSLRRHCRRAHAAFIASLCLLIRTAARLVIAMQVCCAVSFSSLPRGGRRLRPLMVTGMLLTAFALGWWGGTAMWPLEVAREDPGGGAIAIDAVVERIIAIESNGDPNKKNKRSSATGPGQFLDETWLELIRTHRPDLFRGRSQDQILELRRDAKVAREITIRFTEKNAEVLRKRGLPVTPGTLYLAHFAGGAGAVAILTAPDHADAAAAMAGADATGRTKREKIIKANPFLERLTVADLRSWADRKVRVPPS
jgi:hypothetical protein